MEQVTMELFSNESNMAIVRTPGRRFPGMVVQGDSLHILCCSAKEVVLALRAAKAAGASELDEALEEAEELHEALQDRVDSYERCLRAHGMEVPYPNATK
jgi:hypothetical protein